jgi:hypothetical protein
MDQSDRLNQRETQPPKQVGEQEHPNSSAVQRMISDHKISKLLSKAPPASADHSLEPPSLMEGYFTRGAAH